MAGIRDLLKVVWIAFLSSLVITSSGGILLNVHTCLTHNDQYIQLYGTSGHCWHSGSCCLATHASSCCITNSTGNHNTQYPEWVPACCKDQILQLSVGSFLAEQSVEKVLKWVLGPILFKTNGPYWQNEFNIVSSVSNESIVSKAPPLSHRPALLCIFLI